jgi:predicted Zn-dependent protease
MKPFIKIFMLCSVFIFLVNILVPGNALSITPRQEKELSHDFMKLVKKRYTLINDPIIVDYVNRIGQKILSILPSQPFTFHFYVIKEDSYNAFAGPAGHIFINSGLFTAMEDENELAGILGHEITHVVCRHISQRIDRSKKLGIATIAGLEAAIVLGKGSSGAAAEAVMVGTAAAGQSIQLAYSRENEMQADKLGLECLVKAGYDGSGLLSALKKLRSKQWFGSKQIPTYLVTHPAVDARIAYIDTWIQTNKEGAGQRSIDNYAFKRAATWLSATYSDGATALKHFKYNVTKHPASSLAHYGYGLSLVRNNYRKEAIQSFRTALETGRADPYIMKDLGRLYYLEGDYPQALNILNEAFQIDSNNPDIKFHIGLIHMELGELEKAIQLFEKTVLKYPDYEMALYSLGKAYGKQGQLGYAHYYLGLYYDNKGQVKNAVFHLKRAQEKMDDPDKMHKIEKILEAAKSEKKGSAGGN